MIVSNHMYMIGLLPSEQQIDNSSYNILPKYSCACLFVQRIYVIMNVYTTSSNKRILDYSFKLAKCKSVIFIYS